MHVKEFIVWFVAALLGERWAVSALNLLECAAFG
jgi:hypothetical protein